TSTCHPALLGTSSYALSPHHPLPLPPRSSPFLFFFFNDTATTQIYTLSLHDALPICHRAKGARIHTVDFSGCRGLGDGPGKRLRSEEHTSELQSLTNLVCRLLLEKKKKPNRNRQ